MISAHGTGDIGGRYKCEHCDYSFETQKGLGNHIGKKHSGNPNPKPRAMEPVQCKECGKLCTSKSTLSHHMSRVHSTQIFECNQCGKAFNNKQYRDYHIKYTHNKMQRGKTGKTRRANGERMKDFLEGTRLIEEEMERKQRADEAIIREVQERDAALQMVMDEQMRADQQMQMHMM